MARRKYDSLPKPVMDMLLQGAWLVGSAAAWYVGDSDKQPNDYDILVPPDRYQAAVRTLPEHTRFWLTRFGGAHAHIGGSHAIGAISAGFYIDFWPMSLEEFTAVTGKHKMGPQVAFRFDPKTVVRWE